MATSKDGIWLDHETGKIVRKKPARSRQIVAPGKEVTSRVEALVALYEANADTRRVETATAPTVAETRDDVCAGTTAAGVPCSKSASGGAFCHLHQPDGS